MMREIFSVTEINDKDLFRHVSSRKIHCTTLVTMETVEGAKLLWAPDPLVGKEKKCQYHEVNTSKPNLW